MKRVKESYFREHSDWSDINGCSGAKEFEGEDLAYDARIKYQKETQKQWIEQQIREKKMREEAERNEERAYATQTLELNRMRGMLEDDFNRKKASIRQAVKEENQQLDKQKRDLEKQSNNEKLNYERTEIDMVKTRGQKRPFP
uniref:RIB43A protein n=1 Tax=Tetrahymena thermophila CU428 TaxID=452467 RepID=UPI002549C15E|nr:Chain 0X, RIB43A protein [Tetrahymena thermophila CU428]8G2Z_1X Chain 1X, RIB43A protein [Tetrahymena thermophila CU428]8G2Z_2X Chain 2X, RIB43A protein [Tetrahymena thermophila CU428]8G2Z_3X Chain 3X, RIB43A protein [Tetrahymena thermophila CU428]8G2Z_4X Chain 4X, RIB43A protein [Tetrahymena thermophila CU428]